MINKHKSQKSPSKMVAGWSLTTRCNLRCCHCYSAAGTCNPNELTTKEAYEVVDKLYSAGIAAVNFGGGECSLRPDFLEICRYLYQLGIKISYTTNGTTLPRFTAGLEYFHDIGVSIDFATAAEHDKFRGRAGTFEKAVQTLRELVRRDVETEIVTCLTKKNCTLEQLNKLHELAQTLGVHYWRINRFRSNGRGQRNESQLALAPQDLKLVFEFFHQHIPSHSMVSEPLYRAAYGGQYAISGDPSAQTAFRIQADGEVTPSVFLSTSGGNIINQDLEKILSSPIFKAARERRPKGKCKHCNAYQHCRGGDAGCSYLAYGHFSGPDPLCWLDPRKTSTKVEKINPAVWNVHQLYLCTLYTPISEIY